MPTVDLAINNDQQKFWPSLKIFIKSNSFTEKKLKIMSKFSKTFVAYHGCGNCYQDGPNEIVPKNEKCIMQTYNPFWKKPMDVRN